MPAEAKEAVGLNTDTGIKQCRISSSSLCWEQVKPIENLCFIDNPLQVSFLPPSHEEGWSRICKNREKVLAKNT